MKKMIILLVGITVACSGQVESDSEAFLPRKRLAELTNEKLEEVSGLAASKTNPGLMWTHNDSGNDANIFLIDDQLNIKLTCTLKGVDNRDWEDISVGPGPVEGKSYVYIADIGDNFARHQYKYIYRFEEPAFVKSDSAAVEITKFDKITFQLPGPIKDTETLMVNPVTKNLYVISKREEPVYVYELKYPQEISDTITADEIVSLPMTKAVAGCFSPDGKEILIKNYENIFYWKNTKGDAVAEVLKTKPSVLQYRQEPQGEAMTWALDGSGFFTLSEKTKTKKSFLYFYQRN
jgi:hypothetical protein